MYVNDPTQMEQARRLATEQVTKECQNAAINKKDIQCNVVDVLGGKGKKLVKLKVIRDIRLVAAAPQNVGEFGGDIDNFEWPRHAGDFSLFRAYAGPNGEPADSDVEKNIPFASHEIFLPFSDEGYHQGSFMAVIGYPSRSSRYTSSFEVALNQLYVDPNAIEIFKNYLNITESFIKDHPESASELADEIYLYQNAIKSWKGELFGLQLNRARTIKGEEEKGLEKWIGDDPQAKTLYGKVLPDLRGYFGDILNLDAAFPHDGSLAPALDPRQIITKKMARQEIIYRLGWINTTLTLALNFYGRVWERARPESDRLPIGFESNDTGFKTNNVDADPKIIESIDMAKLKFQLERWIRAADLQQVNDLSWFNELRARFQNDTAKMAEWIMTGTQLENREYREKLFQMTLAQFVDPQFLKKHPIFSFVQSMYPDYHQFRMERNARDVRYSKLQPQYIKAIAAYKGREGKYVYDDANSTLRFSWGQVESYLPPPRDNDAIYGGPFPGYYTTVCDIPAKGVNSQERGNFRANGCDTDELERLEIPESLRLAIADPKTWKGLTDSASGTVNVNFLVSTDATNGNSGSPHIDGKGHVSGIHFDSIFESLGSPYLYFPRYRRSIVLDVRYILYFLREVMKSPDLVRELGFVYDHNRNLKKRLYLDR